MAVAVHRLHGLIARYRPTCSITTPALLQLQAYHKKQWPPPREKSSVRVPGAPHAASKEGISAPSAASNTKPTCRKCGKSFSHFDALAKHVRKNHPNLTVAVCPYCTRSFRTYEELAAHVHVRHTPDEYNCPCCTESFGTDIKLAHHIHDHHPPPAPPTDTPIDVFFQEYQTQYHFTYDRSSAPSFQFNRLRKFLRLEKGAEQDRLRARYGSALRAELALWFGGIDFHAMDLFYRAVGYARVEYNILGFFEDLRGKHVNLIDLVHWARHEGSDGETVSVWDDKEELKEYSKQNGKPFPAEYVLGLDPGLGGNAVVRCLLRDVGHRPIRIQDEDWRIPEKLMLDRLLNRT